MATDDRDVIADIMRKTRIAILTYQDAEGRLVSTPMGTQDFEDPGTVWFITEVATEKVRAILANPHVNVAYASDKGWVSLSGTARLSRDDAKLKQLWDASASAFMSTDVDDANSGLLEITGDTAQYWESPGKVPMLVKMAKGLLGGKAADEGDAPVVEL
ncbi:MAG TPA: pyridoxamine 5'-phosphate oxidase family protein [Tetrasphaera sp.]|uniref:pyridoxamine 5'-phosphate oxidase family protein n=1 Tax=Nostocoides sp. TaxID=1917966 RepID=UPI002D0966FA|nr:pyridoxamine 5'-phosphate oxidase family protein [Tetrasphaera sp.]HNQ06369.1 pyridoxamine 5'-phosphate oxidase family protein [Tetrasphaera sp.]